MRTRGATLLALLTALAAIAAVGCGSDNGNDEGTTEPTSGAGGQTQATGGGVLEIKMGDYFFNPASAESSPGSVTVSAPNVGKLEHELVVFRSNASPSSLPVSGGEADEAAFEKQGAVNVGEVEEVAPGETKTATMNLTPGSYVMICNLPGHYQQGMYGSITVK